MEGKGDVARFMPTICHYAGIPLPGTGDDSIQTRAQSSKNMQVNEVMFKLQTFITVLHAKCNNPRERRKINELTQYLRKMISCQNDKLFLHLGGTLAKS